MDNQRPESNLADLAGAVTQQSGSAAEVQRKRLELMATASARGKRVTVTCNADGVPIDIEFADDIDDLGYDDIAMAILEAAQDAAAEVAGKTMELLATIRNTRSRVPSLSSMVDALSDIRTKTPEL